MFSTVVEASKEDMHSVAAIFRSSFRLTYPDFPELHTAEEDIEFFSNVIFSKDSVYIAIEENRVLGFIAFNDEYIDHLYVLKEAQGQGVGSLLLAFAMKDRDTLKLWTFQINVRARA